MTKAAARHPVASTIAWLLVVFLVLFPKGGIKFGDVPLTWGYAVLGLTAAPLAAIRLVRFRLRFRKSVLLAMASLVPFQAVFWYDTRQNGYLGFGSLLSEWTGFVFLPAMFLLVYPSFLRYIDYDFFSRCFRACILYAAIWGIFLFFYRPIFGDLVEVPLLTVNWGDYGQIVATKHIDRGAFLKLISTYNNGNLYGVATLILYPLYMRLEPRLWKRNVLRLALMLTLSRTVWLGLVLEQILSLSGVARELVGTFPRLRMGSARKRVGAVFATLGVVFLVSLLSLRSISFLFDTSLGGRGALLESVLAPTFLPTLPFGGFSEVVYVSVLLILGISGLLGFVLIFFFPVLLMGVFPKLLQRPTSRAAAKGLLLYAVLAAADGAINLIPVLAFYWFAYMVFLCGFPGEREAAPAIASRRPAFEAPVSEVGFAV